MIRALRTTLRNDARLSRVVKGGLSGIVGKFANLFINAISLPITVRYLGRQQYGFWITISTTVLMLSVMDLGITNSLTNLISKAFVDNNRVAARRYYATAFWVSTVICGALALIAFLGWHKIAWGIIFHVQNPEIIRELSQTCAIALAFFLAGLPLNLVHRVLSGYQQTQITNYFNILSSFFGLIAILIVTAMRGSLPMLMLLYSISLLSGTIILNFWVNFWDRTWIMPLPGYIDRSSIGELMNSSIGFFILRLSGLIVFNSDNLVITHYLGAAEVTPYSVTWRIASYSVALQSALFLSLWPAYSEAYTRRDFTWVRATFWRMTRIILSTTSVALLLFGLLGRPLIRWYAGPSAVPGSALLWAICGWTMLGACMDLEACLLAAIDRIRMQGILSLIAAALNVTLSIYLVKRIGSLGVVLGTMISYVLILVVPQTWIAWRALYPDTSDMTDTTENQYV